jgi:hypothetical protein
MQRPRPLDIGPIYIGAQPKPIDTVHIRRPPQDYSLSPHDRGLSIVRQPYLAQRYDGAKYFNEIIKLDLVTTAEKLKPIIEGEYRATIQSLPQALDHEITNITKNHHTASSPHSIESKKHEKHIVDLLTLGKNAQLKSVINQANAFYGSDPLARSMHDLLASIERTSKQRPSHVFQAWSTSYAAAYSALVLSESIRLLTDKSNQLSTTIAVLEAQQVAARQAEIAARAAAEQRAVQAQQAAARQAEIATAQAQQAAAKSAAQETARIEREKAQAKAKHAANIAAQIAQAEHEAREEALWEVEQKKAKERARKREAAKQAARRRKQRVASVAAAEFDSLLSQFTQNRPKDIDEKLRWMKDKYQGLHAKYLAVSKAENAVGGFYPAPGNENRWSALNDVQNEIKTLIRLKYKIEKVQIPPASGAIIAARPLVITADGLIAGFEGSPFSLSNALSTLTSLRKAITSGPISTFLALVFYSPSLGNGEIQRNPIVLTIPLAQLDPDKNHERIGRPATLYGISRRVTSSIRGNHTQLVLESTDYRFPVRVRQAVLDPTTNQYTFTTEGLVPITLTWTPKNPPGNSTPISTELPVTESGIQIYPGARVTQVEGRRDEHPACNHEDPDDYILEFPIDSGIESIYMMATRGGPRYEPGTATGKGQEVGENWLGGATQSSGSPIPAQIADQLRGQDFRNFDRFREKFWRAIASDISLSQQFGNVDLEEMRSGAAPYTDLDDNVGGREKYEIHHKQRIADEGAVYDVDNLTVLTPKAHIELHKSGIQQ